MMQGAGVPLEKLARDTEEFAAGWNAAIEAAAQIAAEYYTGIIRCQKTGNIEHVRMHVEYKWSEEVARRIRARAST